MNATRPTPAILAVHPLFSLFALIALGCLPALGCVPAEGAPDGGASTDAGALDAATLDEVDGGLGTDVGTLPDAPLDVGDPSDSGAMRDGGGGTDTGVDSRPVHIVVIGSSTAEGKNLDEPMYGGRVGGLVDRWSDRYEATLVGTRPGSTVVNIARAGYATYSALPTGTAIAATWPPSTGFPDPVRNITHAIGMAPDAIIVNMPLVRELLAGESLDALMANLHTMVDAAEAAGIEVWIATTAATASSTATDIAAIRAANARTLTEFAPRVIDFHPTCALASGAADPALRLSDASGHPNAACHLRLRDAVVAAAIPEAVLP